MLVVGKVPEYAVKLIVRDGLLSKGLCLFLVDCVAKVAGRPIAKNGQY